MQELLAEQDHQLVAPQDAAGRIDGAHAIGVAVERDAELRTLARVATGRDRARAAAELGYARIVDGPSPEQIAIYRAMTPAERLKQATALYWAARRLRAAHERALHPDWTEEQVEAHVRRVFLHATT